MRNQKICFPERDLPFSQIQTDFRSSFMNDFGKRDIQILKKIIRDGFRMKEKIKTEQDQVFKNFPVPKALRVMIVPAVISQLIVLNSIFGMYGIVWSQVTADTLTVLLSFYVYRRFRPGQEEMDRKRRQLQEKGTDR